MSLGKVECGYWFVTPSPEMNELRLFAHWLWNRPVIERFNVRLPIPRVFSFLFFYGCFIVASYLTTKLFAQPSQQERFESFYRNPWMQCAIGLFFCILAINAYLAEKFPSAKKGFVAQFSSGKRDPKNPVVLLGSCLGVLCLISFVIGYFQTWGKP